MKNLIDTIFHPFVNFLNQLIDLLGNVTMPADRPVNILMYLNPFGVLGTAWITLIQSFLALLVLYFIIYFIKNGQEMLIKFKDTIKWW